MKAIIALFLMTVPALAQTPSPSSLALSINAAIGQLAQQAEAAQQQAQRLQAEVDRLNKELAAAQAKPAQEK